MELSHRVENNICIVTIIGELHANSKKFRAFLQPFLEDFQNKGLLINLDKVPFISSTTIGILLEAHQTLQNRRGRLALCHLNEMNRKILNFTQINHIIETYPTEKNALDSMAES